MQPLVARRFGCVSTWCLHWMCLWLTAEVIQWKKYLTTMQITQFVIDLFAVYFGSKSH